MPALATHRSLVLVAVIAANFMIAIEATIVSTAMPQIIAELGGLSLYSWVFAAFLLTQTATTVVFGKLSESWPQAGDVLGHRDLSLRLAALRIRLVDAVADRLPAGPGRRRRRRAAGGMTIVGDLYSAHERGKIQGWLASVWAVSAVIGPLVGGLIIAACSWAWIFWMNLPIGIAAAAGFLLYLHENPPEGRGPIDHLSAGSSPSPSPPSWPTSPPFDRKRSTKLASSPPSRSSPSCLRLRRSAARPSP